MLVISVNSFLIIYWEHNLTLCNKSLIVSDITGEPQETGQKYEALYQFDSRSHDELSFMPGDIIYVRLFIIFIKELIISLRFGSVNTDKKYTAIFCIPYFSASF